MKLKPTRATLGILAGVVVLTGALLGALAWFQNSSLADANKLLQQKEQELADGQAVARRLEDVRARLDEDRSEVEFLEAQVADAAYIPTLLKQLEDLSIRTTNRVVGIRPIVVVQAPTRLQQRRDPEAQAKAEGKETSADPKSKEEEEKKKKEAEPYTKQGIQITLIGTYATSQLMAQQLTRFPKILSVDEVQIRPHRKGSYERNTASNLLDVEMKVTAYILKKRPAGGAAPAAKAGEENKGGSA